MRVRYGPATVLIGSDVALESRCRMAPHDLTVLDALTVTLEGDPGIARPPSELEGRSTLGKVLHEPGDLRGAC